jgi:parallel beta-helix repeat protein
MTLTPLIVIISTLRVIVVIFSTNTAESKPLFTTEQASITRHKTVFSPSSPIKESNTGSSSPSCITYTPSTRTITVTCTSASMTEIYNKLQDNSILNKQSSPQGGTSNIWFLNANLIIAKGATFHIDSTNTKWLKISSKVTRGAGSAKIAPAYILDVHGSLKIDSVKITSWDPTTNYYAITSGSRTGDITHPGAPRPSIVVENCILIENNKVHDNTGDGIDFSRNMYNSIARNNIIYNEPAGVIVSQSHYNQIYNNTVSTSGNGICVVVNITLQRLPSRLTILGIE